MKNTIFCVSYTFAHASLWVEFATQITRDRETGVSCEGFMGSAEAIILPLPLHMICWFLEVFFPHIAIEVKTTAELASRGRKQKNARHLHNMNKCHQKWHFDVMQTNFTSDSLLNTGITTRVGAHRLHLQHSCMWLKSWPNLHITHGSSNCLLCYRRP